MAIAPHAPIAGPPAEPATSGSRMLFMLSLGLFFLWGLATVLIDILVPKLKAVFLLSYTEVMLTQFAFFLGYFVFSLPAGALVSRVGYIPGIIIGLAVMAGGCLLFAPAAGLGIYAGFLAALFIMAAGITLLQVSANAVIAVTGKTETSSARLTLAQAFNSLGTTIGPLIGARMILGEDVNLPADVATLSPQALGELQRAEAAVVQTPFLMIAALLFVMIFVFWTFRRALPDAAREAASPGLGLTLLGRRNVLFGVIAIFAYVGAEVSIGSLLVNYLMQPHTLAASALHAGELVSLYWGGAMIGRFIGSFILGRVTPGLVLLVSSLVAILFAAVSTMTTGIVSACAILGIGLFNSIMFPTIFSLGLKDTGLDAPKVAGLLCMGIVGGAILPVLAGLIADQSNLELALLVPIFGYAWVAFYGAFSAQRDRAARGWQAT